MNLTFLNASIKNKYIYKMFQIVCLVNVVYTLNACVLHYSLLLLHSLFAAWKSVFSKNDINWHPQTCKLLTYM